MIAKREEKEKKIFYQTFKGHTSDALKILRTYIEYKSDVLTAFCTRWNLEEKPFIKDLFLMVVFHDIAKLTIEFQNNIKNGRHSQDYPHSFWALPIVSQLPFSTAIVPFPVLAILGHHTQLHSEMYVSVSKKVNYCTDEIDRFAINGIFDLYNTLGFSQCFDLTPIKIKIPKPMKPKKVREKFIKPFRHTYSDVRIKSIYTYFLSILQLCDDYSSAHSSHVSRRDKYEDATHHGP